MEHSAESSVLVIDDEANVVSAIRRALRSEPYRVECTTDPVEGLEIAKTLNPTVVICDMRMPGLTGSEVFAALSRSNPRCGRILLTGYADINSTIAAINQGHIDLYMTKPWNDDELKLKLQQHIRLVSLKNEREQLAAQLASKVKELSRLNNELDQRVESRTQELRQTNLFLEQAFSELNQQFLNAIKVFSNMIELSSPQMAGHHYRVAELARFIAIQMALSEVEIRDIHIAGLLHDIGKLDLAERDLNTSLASLSATTRMALMKHPIKGQAALLALPELSNVASIIRQHHERVDGLGYPDGLTGQEILRGAKVLAVAEDWDELQLGWLTEQKLGLEQCFVYINQAAG
ncbi:MAG: HD domain-containing phosphohydrolase [Limnobacter sp.]